MCRKEGEMFEELPNSTKFVFNYEFNEKKEMSMQTAYTVYSLINKKSRKRYIGLTKNPKKRISSHFYALNSGRHINENMQNDFEYGFEYEIIETDIPWSSAREKELFYMKKYKTYDSRFGYNEYDTRFQKGGILTKLGKELIKQNVREQTQLLGFGSNAVTTA